MDYAVYYFIGLCWFLVALVNADKPRSFGKVCEIAFINILFWPILLIKKVIDEK